MEIYILFLQSNKQIIWYVTSFVAGTIQRLFAVDHLTIDVRYRSSGQYLFNRHNRISSNGLVEEYEMISVVSASDFMSDATWTNLTWMRDMPRSLWIVLFETCQDSFIIFRGDFVWNVVFNDLLQPHNAIP